MGLSDLSLTLAQYMCCWSAAASRLWCHSVWMFLHNQHKPAHVIM